MKLERATLFVSLLLFSAIVLLYIVANNFGLIPAIKGLYAVIGLLLSVIVLTFSNIKKHNVFTLDYYSENKRYSKVCFILLLICAPLTYMSGTRMPIILLIIPLFYLLLGTQISRKKSSRKLLLTQIIFAFFIINVTKYIDTYRYFGNGDLISHTGKVERLVQAGELYPLGLVYSLYPNIFIEAGVLHLIGNITEYDGMIITGIIASLTGILALYLISRHIYQNHNFPMLIILCATLVSYIQFYTIYVFPQSLAVIFALLVIYFSLRSDPAGRRFSILSFVAASGMVFTHHFTFVMTLPILTTLFIFQNIRLKTFTTENIENSAFKLIPLFLPGVMAMGYWHVNKHNFFGQMSYAIRIHILEGTIFTDTSTASGTKSIFTFGIELVKQSPSEAFLSILTFNGIYFTTLVFVFSMGLASILYLDEGHKRSVGFLIIGLMGSFLIFRTPISLSSRLAHPFSFFFAFILAYGLKFLFTPGRSRDVVAITTIIILATTAPIVAGGDLYLLHSGPDFYDSYTTPSEQQEFSAKEYEEIDQSSKYIKKYDSEISTFWMSSLALSRFGIKNSDNVNIVGCQIQSGTDSLYYRTKWTEHQVYFDGARNRLIISDNSFDYMVSSSNKIYSSSITGILWSKDEKGRFNSKCLA